MPPITNYSKFISRRSARRMPSAIRKLTPLVSLPGMISLAGGLPNPAGFPFSNISVSMNNGTSLNLSGDTLAKALQYSASPGLPDLVGLLKTKMEKLHRYQSPEKYELMVGVGSQDLLAKVFDALVNEGDDVLVENPTYSGARAAFGPIGCRLRGVPTDQHGIIPAAFRQAIKDYRDARVLYTIPTGQNPSGATTSSSRRHEIYAIASEHNIIIIEDDPYYFLYLDGEFVPQPPSYLSMDVDRRVIRLDSFSKVLSSGMRLGWVTGPKELVEQIHLDLQGSCMHASGLSQVVVLELMKQWGEEGWNKHVSDVQAMYRKKRDTFLGLCDKHLTGLATWHKPSAGMFVWFTLNGITDSSKLISEKAMNQKVLLVPGEAFLPESGPLSGCVRASYSLATDAQMDEGLRRLATLLKEENKA